jgi:hypothetical protein
MLNNAGAMDPFGNALDGSLSKFSHYFDNGQDVRVKATGHRGKIVGRAVGSEHHFHVRLDSGHEVRAHRDELEPSDFPSAHHGPVSSKTSTPGFAKTLLSQFDGLRTADVSAHDQVIIERERRKIETGAYAANPLDIDGTDDPEPIRLLKVIKEKYPDKSSVGDTFVKAHGGDRVGQLIERAIAGLNAGKNIVMPPECRAAFERMPSLRALVESGRICFDYAG